MKEYEITYINQFKTDKNGNPYKGKTGPFVRVSIKVPEHGNEYVSGLWFGADCPWKVGDKVMMEIKPEEYQGKTQLKFELPKKENANAKLLEEIQNTLTKHSMLINQFMTALGELQKKVNPDNYPYPEKLGYKAEEMANFDKKPEKKEDDTFLFDKEQPPF